MVGGGGSSAGGTGGAPKILLAKPAVSRSDTGAASSGPPAGVVKLMRDREDDTSVRTRLPHGSLNLLSDSWEIFPDRLLPLMSDNSDFTVIGVLGPPGVGKSTILNELYGFDGNSSGVLPPFSVQSEETKAMAKHCSVGIELRMSVERFILLDTQPVFSASVLTELMRPDGSSAISVLGGETLSAELAHELMSVQLGVFLASVCHVLLVVTEGLHDISLWRLMLTVEMLKQGIPDPSLLNSSTTAGGHLQQPQALASSILAEKDDSDILQEDPLEFFSDAIFVHTKLREHECSWYNIKCLEKALSLYFPSPAFRRNGSVRYIPPQFSSKIQKHLYGGYRNGLDTNMDEDSITRLAFDSCKNIQNGKANLSPDNDRERLRPDVEEAGSVDNDEIPSVNYFVLPLRASDDAVRMQHESYTSMLRQLRDQILSMPRRSFARPITEREWLRNAARMWDLVRKSPVLADYSRTLQNSGLYRR